MSKLYDNLPPFYACPVEGCGCFVIDWLGALWDCGYHGLPMVYVPDYGIKLLPMFATPPALDTYRLQELVNV